jgi:hypothetical protein
MNRAEYALIENAFTELRAEIADIRKTLAILDKRITHLPRIAVSTRSRKKHAPEVNGNELKRHTRSDAILDALAQAEANAIEAVDAIVTRGASVPAARLGGQA